MKQQKQQRKMPQRAATAQTPGTEEHTTGEQADVVAPALKPAVAELVERLVATAREVLQSPNAEAATRTYIGELGEVPAAIGSLALRQIAGEEGDHALPLLEAALRNDNPMLASVAVNALGLVASERSALLLSATADAAASGVIRKAARKELFRLRSKGVPTPTKTPVPREERAVKPQATVFSALASHIDGHGDRLFELGVELAVGGVESLSIMANERKGVVRCEAIPMGRRRFFSEKATILAEEFPTWVEIPVAYARQLLHEAYQRNLAQAAGAPLDFLRWQKVIAEPETAMRPIVYEEISPLEVKWNPQLLEESPDIIDEPEVMGWVPPPAEIEEYARRIEEAGRTTSIIVLSPWATQERVKKAKEQALEDMFGKENRTALKRRLEETAYIFLRTERPLHAKRAIAAALALQDSSVSLSANAFVTALLERSLALFRLSREGGLEASRRVGRIHLP